MTATQSTFHTYSTSRTGESKKAQKVDFSVDRSIYLSVEIQAPYIPVGNLNVMLCALPSVVARMGVNSMATEKMATKRYQNSMDHCGYGPIICPRAMLCFRVPALFRSRKPDARGQGYLSKIKIKIKTKEIFPSKSACQTPISTLSPAKNDGKSHSHPVSPPEL